MDNFRALRESCLWRLTEIAMFLLLLAGAGLAVAGTQNKVYHYILVLVIVGCVVGAIVYAIKRHPAAFLLGGIVAFVGAAFLIGFLDLTSEPERSPCYRAFQRAGAEEDVINSLVVSTLTCTDQVATELEFAKLATRFDYECRDSLLSGVLTCPSAHEQYAALHRVPGELVYDQFETVLTSQETSQAQRLKDRVLLTGDAVVAMIISFGVVRVLAYFGQELLSYLKVEIALIANVLIIALLLILYWFMPNLNVLVDQNTQPVYDALDNLLLTGVFLQFGIAILGVLGLAMLAGGNIGEVLANGLITFLIVVGLPIVVIGILARLFVDSSLESVEGLLVGGAVMALLIGMAVTQEGLALLKNLAKEAL